MAAKKMIQLLLLAISSGACAFRTAPSRVGCWRPRQLQARSHGDDDTARAFLPEQQTEPSVDRRRAVSAMLATSALLPYYASNAEEPENIFAPKFVQEYPGRSRRSSSSTRLD